MAATKENSKPKPHYDQKSEPGNDGHSGLPMKSDGSYRDSSDLKKTKK